MAVFLPGREFSLCYGVRTFSPGPRRLWMQSRISFRSAREGFPASSELLDSCSRSKRNARADCRSMPAWAIARLQQENRRLLEVLRRRLPHVGLPPWLTASEQSSSNSSGPFGQVARRMIMSITTCRGRRRSENARLSSEVLSGQPPFSAERGGDLRTIRRRFDVDRSARPRPLRAIAVDPHPD